MAKVCSPVCLYSMFIDFGRAGSEGGARKQGQKEVARVEVKPLERSGREGSLLEGRREAAKFQNYSGQQHYARHVIGSTAAPASPCTAHFLPASNCGFRGLDYLVQLDCGFLHLQRDTRQGWREDEHHATLQCQEGLAQGNPRTSSRCLPAAASPNCRHRHLGQWSVCNTRKKNLRALEQTYTKDLPKPVWVHCRLINGKMAGCISEIFFLGMFLLFFIYGL